MHSIWHDMFTLAIPILEKILRPLIVYAFLVLAFRLAGKRELAQLNPFDLVVLLTISNTVQNAIIGEDNSVTGGVIGAATLLVANYAVVRFLFGHQKLDQLIEGEADVLFENGILREDRLKKEVITRSELETALHKQGFTGLNEVERIVLEPGGNIFVTGKRSSLSGAPPPDLSGRVDIILRNLEEIRQKLGMKETG